MKYKDGTYTITNEQYHSSEGTSRSALWAFKQSPRNYWDKYLNPLKEPDKPNPNFILGELVHCQVLEPQEFNKRYTVEPGLFAVPKVGRLKDIGREDFDIQKNIREDVLASNQAIQDRFAGLSHGKQIISTAQAQISQDMTASVLDSEMAKSLFCAKDSQIEKSIYFTDEATQLQFKCRPDSWTNTIVVDLKTTKSCQYEDFQNSCYKYGYFLQAAFIKMGLKSLGIDMKSFIFYIVEKTPPYQSVYYILDEEALAFGAEQFHMLAEAFAECKSNDEWPSYPAQYLSIPPYANKI